MDVSHTLEMTICVVNQLKNDHYHGEGKLRKKNGLLLEGKFREDKRFGYGKTIFPD